MSDAVESVDEFLFVNDALNRFSVLIDDIDFQHLLEPMPIGRFDFLLRKKMRIELKGLLIGLWRLALARSFPNAADKIFSIFLKEFTSKHPGKADLMAAERAVEYWEMLKQKGDSDFQNIAAHFVSFLTVAPNDNRSIILKLALSIRQAYRFIFERLI